MIRVTVVLSVLAATAASQVPWVQKIAAVGEREHDMVYDSTRQRVVMVQAIEQEPAFWVNLVWEWDGANWTAATPSPDPLPGRRGHALAYDPIRQHVVLFGGENGSGAQGDTWTWDGETWTQRFPTTSPPARCGHAMIWDPVRSEVVMFGGQREGCTGCATTTWIWNGSDWAARPTATSPSERRFAEMAWDDARQNVLMYGGVTPMNDPLGQTWEWNGTDWTQRFPTNSPPAITGPAVGLAYEPAGQRVIAYGGSETWAWDGLEWIQLFGGTPPIQNGCRLVHDERAQRIVLFGRGVGRDTWIWDGAGWGRSPGAVAPPAREHHAMAYMPLQQRTVMFGGGIGTRTSEFADTWEWDGFAWQARTGTPSPDARHAHKMAATGDGALLFGGETLYGAGFYRNDTWLWNGSRWFDITGTGGPAPRAQHAMAFDCDRNTVVMFSGERNGSPLIDTWEWNGQWVQRFPATSPLARRGHAMAYDRARQVVVMFAGDLQDGTDHVDDTWEYDGTTWIQRFPATIPPGRTGHAMAYDAVRQRVVVMGGWDVGVSLEPFGDIWEWDGVDWVEVIPAEAPRPRARNALVFDEVRQQLMMFGGSEPFGIRRAMDETWITGQLALASATEYGAGCGGANGIPELRGFGAPRLGNGSFALDVLSARDNAAMVFLFSLGTGAFPLPSGCQYLLDPITTVLNLPALASASGFASLPIPIPAEVAFAGAGLTSQAAILDATLPFGLSMTNGLDVRFGY